MDLSALTPAAPSGGYQRKPTAQEAAVEFEAIILKQLLQAAREASEPLAEESSLTGASNYHDFAERFLARTLAEREALGFADLIRQDLGRRTAEESQNRPQVLAHSADQ